MTAPETFPLDSPALLELRRLCKLGQMDDLVKFARQHPKDAAELLGRIVRISARVDGLKRKDYSKQIAALRLALSDKLSPAEIEELRRISLERGQELQKRLGINGLA